MKKIFNPNLVLFYFILFLISIVTMYISFDYTFKKLKSLILIFYFIPGLLFFIISSVYNYIKHKKESKIVKIVSVIPILVIMLYFVFMIVLAIYAVLFK